MAFIVIFLSISVNFLFCILTLAFCYQTQVLYFYFSDKFENKEELVYHNDRSIVNERLTTINLNPVKPDLVIIRVYTSNGDATPQVKEDFYVNRGKLIYKIENCKEILASMNKL